MTVYPDSMLWVYFFERNPQFHPATRAFMARCQAARHQFLSSYLVLAEVLVVPKRRGDVFTSTRYRRFLNPAAFTMIPLLADAAESFADLRASHRVKPADALHLALAASAGTNYFVTFDSKLHGVTVPGIGKICSPEDVP